MPHADAPFIIGVIREKEKQFLQEDEYTRIIAAPSAGDALRVLADTPYGIHLTSENPLAAFDLHLDEELAWLRSVVEDENVVHFMGARYDALAIAEALAAKHAGETRMPATVVLGSIHPKLLQQVIWEGLGTEEAPEIWQQFLSTERRALTEDATWSVSDMLVRVKRQLVLVLLEVADTPLMRDIAELTKEHLAMDTMTRPGLSDSKKGAAVPEGFDAALYERSWDEKLVALLRSQKSVPIGFDPVIAYWFAKELEAKTVRMIISAKLGGLPVETMERLKRPLYLSSNHGI